MSSSGPNSPGTIVSDSAVGTVAWSNPTNASASDDSRAAAGGSGSGSNFTTEYLKATNFGFSIPSGSTIDGIKVEIEKLENFSDWNIYDSTVKLVVGGSVVGDDKSSASEWPTSEAYTTYGGESDKWGLTPTATQINSSDFGVVISALVGKYEKTAYVDHIRITVYYTEPTQLVISECSHAVSSDNITLSQQHTLAVQGADHGISNDSISLIENKTLIVQESTHGLSTGGVTLIENKTLIVDDGQHTITVDAIKLVENKTLSIQESSHAITSDNINVIENQTIETNDCSHGHSVDSILLISKIFTGVWTPLSIFPNDATVISIVDVEEGSTYDLRIRYRDKNGKVGDWVTYSDYTVIGKSTAPAAPTSCTATQVELAIKLTWTNPSVPDFSYTGIWRHTADSFPGGDPDYSVAGGPGEKMAFIDEGITIGTTYYYWFASYDTAGNASSQTSSVNSSAQGVLAGHIETGTLAAGTRINVGDNVEIDADDECYRVFADEVAIAEDVNDMLDWSEDSVVKAATLTAGNYTPANLAAHVQTKMRAEGDADTVVTYNSTTRKITIANSTLTTLSLLWSSGTNADETCGEALGFSITADDTGALTYTADLECCLRCIMGKLS